MCADTEVSCIVLTAAWSKKQIPCLADLKSGVMSKVCFFQAALGESKMPFMKAFPCKEQKYWVSGLIDAIEYYGGLPALIDPRAHNTPKILGYLSASKDSAFGMFSKFYGIPVLPVNLNGLPLSPDIDVFMPSDWVLRQLQDKVFYSFDELNNHVSLLLSRCVSLPSSSIMDSRLNVFRIRDKPLLKPLPQQRYSIIDICHRVTGDNCFIKYGKIYYSVPYMFCKQQVTLHVSNTDIIIYDSNGIFLASHKLGGNTKYVTDPFHMPPQNTLFGSQIYDGGKYVQWAGRIGRNTRSVIECLLAREKYEQRAFKACMAIIQLSKKYGSYRLESACRAAKMKGCISYRSINRMLADGADGEALSTVNPISNDYIQLMLDDEWVSF